MRIFICANLVQSVKVVRMLPGIQPPCDQIAGGFVQLANSFAIKG